MNKILVNISPVLFKTIYCSENIFIRHYTARRALMYVPGNDIRKLNKAFGLDVDCIAMDCEDGVAVNKKKEARKTISDILNAGKPQKNRNFDWAVRVNSVDSSLCKDDLNSVLTCKHLPDTVLLPKVESTDHIKWFAAEVSRIIEMDSKINLIIYIESALAFVNLIDICKEATNSKNNKYIPVSLVFGSDDFCADIGATRTEDSMETLYARQKLVLVAKAFGLQAIDMVYIKYKDLEGLRLQSEQGARMGYTGKQVIHPDQVPVVQKAFLTNEKQREWASGLLTSFEKHQKTGKGAFTYKGSMIDMPTMKQAQNIMELVKLIDK